jgi:hypothetical protein
MVPFSQLLDALSEVPDPRRAEGKRYPLVPLLLFTSPASAALRSTSCAPTVSKTSPANSMSTPSTSTTPSHIASHSEN